MTIASETLRVATCVFIHLPYSMDARRYRERYFQGLEPDESPYGFHQADRNSFELHFSRDRSGIMFRGVRLFLREVLTFDILHAMANLSRMRSADVFWTMTEGEALGIACLMYIGVLRDKPIIGNAVWIFDKWQQLPRWKQGLLRKISTRIDQMTVHSKACLPIAKTAFPTIDSEFQPFGVNAEMFKPLKKSGTASANQIRVLSVGYDWSRDWDTLLEAFGNRPDFQVKVLSRRIRTGMVTNFKNVSRATMGKMEDYIDLFRWADVVVITMKENIYSGITVALEAVAMHVPLVCSRTGGIPSYFDEQEVTYCRPGSAGELREAVLSQHRSSEAKVELAYERFVANGYTTKALIDSYERRTQEALAAKLVHA